MKNIVLIGSGNVATHLGLSLYRKGYKIKQVWSRRLENSEVLAKKLNSTATDSLNKLKNADLYIVAVKDDILESIILQLDNINIIHTSGSMGLEVFGERFINHGILYPLQTFNKHIFLDISSTPIFIETNNKYFEKDIIDLGSNLSDKVMKMNSIQRKQLHIAAIFACNFTNHMYTIAHSILKESNIEFDLLLPIIKQTINKLNAEEPSKIQTGPAKRKDTEIINNHINNLSDKTIKEIYKLISKSIMNDDK